MRRLRRFRRMDGKTFRKFKGWSGTVYWVEMEREEVIERRRYHAAGILAPIVMIAWFAWAAGLI